MDRSEARILGSQNYIHDNGDNIAEVPTNGEDLQVIKEEEEIVQVDPLEEPLEDIRGMNNRDQHQETCTVKEEEPDPLAADASDAAEIIDDVIPLSESPVNPRALAANKRRLFEKVSVITDVECNKRTDINNLNGSIKNGIDLNAVTFTPINDTKQKRIKCGIKENEIPRKSDLRQKSDPNEAEIISDDDSNQTCEMKEKVTELKIESNPSELETIADPDDPPYSQHAKVVFLDR